MVSSGMVERPMQGFLMPRPGGARPPLPIQALFNEISGMGGPGGFMGGPAGLMGMDMNDDFQIEDTDEHFKLVAHLPGHRLGGEGNNPLSVKVVGRSLMVKGKKVEGPMTSMFQRSFPIPPYAVAKKISVDYSTTSGKLVINLPKIPKAERTEEEKGAEEDGAQELDGMLPMEMGGFGMPLEALPAPFLELERAMGQLIMPQPAAIVRIRPARPVIRLGKDDNGAMVVNLEAPPGKMLEQVLGHVFVVEPGSHVSEKEEKTMYPNVSTGIAAPE